MGERLWIAIATSRGFHRGETEILSRWSESASGGGRRRIGLRISIPASLTHIQRRFTLRVPVAFDLAPTAMITRMEGDPTPFKVPILDLSESGVLVRAPISAEFKLDLPVKIAATFPQPLSDLAKSIRALDVRRGKRPAA